MAEKPPLPAPPPRSKRTEWGKVILAALIGTIIGLSGFYVGLYTPLYNEIASHKARAERAESEVANLTAQLMEANRSINDLHVQLNNYSTWVTSLHNEIDTLNARIHQLLHPSLLFPFYLPWNDSEETAVSLSSSPDKPAGRLGNIYVGADGHLYTGGKRIRLLGVNIAGSAAFPSKGDAEGIAARLAKFGINVVRFHLMDDYWEPNFNIFNKTFGNTRHLNQEALDRLDYFIYQLEKNGIYTDLNLLVGRAFTNADGLPAEVNEVDPKDQQVLGFFVDEITSLERACHVWYLTKSSTLLA